MVNRGEESTFQECQISIDCHHPNHHHHHHHFVHLDRPPWDVMVGLEGELVELTDLEKKQEKTLFSKYKKFTDQPAKLLLIIVSLQLLA